MGDFFAKGNKAISGFGGDTTPHRIDFNVWNGYTEEQKTALKQQYKNIHIMNVPEATGYIDADLLVKLWENPAPTASFADQDITLASDDYDYLIVYSYFSSSISYAIPTNMVKKGDSLWLNYYFNTSDWGVRVGLYINDTKYHFNVGFKAGVGDNNQCIPVAIYGIKQSLSLKFQAIAHDVKATVDYSTDEHVIGTWIDGSTLYEKTVSCGNMPDTTTKNVAHMISNIALVVDIKGFCYYGNTVYVPIPRAVPAGNSTVDVVANNSNIIITTVDNYSPYTAYVTLRYTKTS